MPEDHIIPAGDYRIRKRFRNEEVLRRKRDLPWSKKVLDLDHNKLFGRTAWGWCRIIGFYLVLYLLLALIVVFWILIFVHFMYKPDRPLWLKGAPGVSIVPTGMSTIDFHPHDETEIDPIADNIDRFFNKVEASGRSKNVFDACNRDKTWGYYEKEPCVFVKLNKVYGFEPETYESESELPKDSPSEIADLMAQYGGFAKIWLTCDATDEENSPSINYIPYPYFDTSTDMKGLNRVVALQLSEIPTNEDITIICKVWAKNIRIDMEYRGTGHTKFTIKMRGKA